jgi:hypothetical protein
VVVGVVVSVDVGVVVVVSVVVGEVVGEVAAVQLDTKPPSAKSFTIELKRRANASQSAMLKKSSNTHVVSRNGASCPGASGPECPSTAASRAATVSSHVAKPASVACRRVWRREGLYHPNPMTRDGGLRVHMHMSTSDAKAERNCQRVAFIFYTCMQ